MKTLTTVVLSFILLLFGIAPSMATWQQQEHNLHADVYNSRHLENSGGVGIPEPSSADKLKDDYLLGVQGDAAVAVVGVYAVPGVGEVVAAVTAGVAIGYITYRAYEKAKAWYEGRRSSKTRRKGTASERERWRSRGVAESRLGPSGKPKRHGVRHNSRKRAKDSARRASKGKRPPIHHPDSKMGHYHPSDNVGGKYKPNVHHYYPKSK